MAFYFTLLTGSLYFVVLVWLRFSAAKARADQEGGSALGYLLWGWWLPTTVRAEQKRVLALRWFWGGLLVWLGVVGLLFVNFWFRIKD